MSDLADVRERLARLETKMDMLLDRHKHSRASFVAIVSVVASGATTAVLSFVLHAS